MVGAWLDAVKDGVALHRKAGSLVLSPQQVTDFDKTNVPALIANWVSHFETGQTMPFTPAVLKSCLDDIDSSPRLELTSRELLALLEGLDLSSAKWSKRYERPVCMTES